MKRAILAISITVFAILLFALENPQNGGSIKIGLQADIETIYPWNMTSTEAFMVFQNVYETLVRLSENNAEIRPCLAIKWAPSADYKKWTFYLRKNVKFHDGTALDANAVVSSLALSPSIFASISKVDDYTVVFDLKNPNAAFLVTLGMRANSVVAPATIKCFKEKCGKSVAVGTGPFAFQSWQPGKEIILRANDNYWGGRPYLDEVVFYPFKSDADMIQALKNQTIHISPTIPPKAISEIRNTSHLTFQAKPALALTYLGMNTSKAPFDNKKVRIAISYAINRKEMVNKYFFGGQAGAAAKSCLPIEMFGYDKELPEREYNPEKAKLLLKEAGYPNGFETTLLQPAVNRPYMPDHVQMTQDIQKALAAIGIKAQIVYPKSWDDFLNTSLRGNYDVVLFGWIADTLDPNDFLTSMLAGSSLGNTNAVRWSNPAFDSLLEKARYQSINDRLQTYHDAQKIFYEEMPFIPIANALQLNAWNQRVRGYVWHPTASRLYLHKVWLSP